jgi:hypothetical protein
MAQGSVWRKPYDKVKGVIKLGSLKLYFQALRSSFWS